MATPGLKPFNSNPFLRVTDFAVPVRGLIICLQEYDDTEDLGYIYKPDGTFVESKPGVPRDGGAIGWYNHTDFAKVGGDVFSIDGGTSNYDVYKNGVGFIGYYPSSSDGITSHGKTIWVRFQSGVQAHDSTTGALLSSNSFSDTILRHKTNGTNHVYTYYRSSPAEGEWEYRHILSDSGFGSEVVLDEAIKTDPVTPISFLDVAINSDRVAVISWNYNTSVSSIKIYDLSGVLKDTLSATGQAEMLLMSDDKVYASNAATGVITMWDITEAAGEKVYTPAGSFNTPSPYVLYGNLVT